MKQHRLLNFDINLCSYDEFINEIFELATAQQSAYVCFANVHMFIEAQKSPLFLHIINSANLVATDGKPMTWTLNFFYGIKQSRIAGMDLLPDLISKCEKYTFPVYFYGGTVETLNLTSQHLRKHFPNLNVAGVFSPPFRSLTKEEEQTFIDNINKTGAKIIFVSLGCPKQEMWMFSMVNRINAVMIGIGGALPVFIGKQKRAPKWMQNAGLEWCYRFYLEPKRLWKRYLITNSTFIFMILREKIRNLFLRNTKRTSFPSQLDETLPDNFPLTRSAKRTSYPS